MRKKLMQLVSAMESHSTDELGDNWQEAIFALVENGPMAADEIGGEEAIKNLKNEGHVTDVYVSDGTWKPAVTRKGVELYCQVVGEPSVEKAIERRKEWLAEDQGQAEEAVDHAEAKAEDEAQDAINTADKAAEVREIAQEEVDRNYAENYPDASGQDSNLNGETIATESFLDVVKDLFGKKKTLRGQDAQGFTYRKENQARVVEVLKKTVIDPKWVQKNLKNQVSLSVSKLADLAPEGKILKPSQVLPIREKLAAADLAKAPIAALQAYDKALNAGEKEIEAYYKKNGSDGLEAFAESVMKKIKVPAVTVPYSFNDYSKVLNNFRTSKPALPELTVEDVVQAGNAILVALTKIDAMNKHPINNISPGSGMDTEDFWEDEEVGDDLRTGDVGDFFYFQGVPEQVSGGYALNLSHYGASIEASLYWIGKATGLFTGQDSKIAE